MKIDCAGEPGTFDASEFRHDPTGQLVTPYIHDRIAPHYASTGQLVTPTIHELMAHINAFASLARHLKFAEASTLLGDETLELPETESPDTTAAQQPRHDLLALTLYQEALTLSTEDLEALLRYTTTLDQERQNENGQPKQSEQTKRPAKRTTKRSQQK